MLYVQRCKENVSCFGFDHRGSYMLYVSVCNKENTVAYVVQLLDVIVRTSLF